MAKKSKKPRDSQAVKSGLKTLREKGLYKPEKSRAAPTKYAKSLLTKFADVLTGKASVVTASAKGRKGFAAAAKYKTGAKDAPGTVRVVRNKIVVPTQGGETARFTKSGKVRVTRRVGRDVYVREPFPGRVKSLDDILRSTKSNERIAVPLYRGQRGVEWMNMTAAEFKAFYSQYAATYKDLGDFVEKFRLEGPSAEILPAEEREAAPPKAKPKTKKKPARKRRLV